MLPNSWLQPRFVTEVQIAAKDMLRPLLTSSVFALSRALAPQRRMLQGAAKHQRRSASRMPDSEPGLIWATGTGEPISCKAAVAFGVDDVRLTDDVRVEKDESHPGKVIQRAWYERNKHIFPASRWEVYDPAAKRDRSTIHGAEVNAKE